MLTFKAKIHVWLSACSVWGLKFSIGINVIIVIISGQMGGGLIREGGGQIYHNMSQPWEYL